jgi:6-phosphogluconate dehydrogenase
MLVPHSWRKKMPPFGTMFNESSLWPGSNKESWGWVASLLGKAKAKASCSYCCKSMLQAAVSGGKGLM